MDFPEVYFVGNNGQGKTNLLECLYFLCYGSSFRTKNDDLIQRHNTHEMAVSASFLKSDKSLNQISIQLVKNQKSIVFNGNKIFDRRDIMFNMPCIVFCHGDLEFVVGSPDKKRIFFDQTLSLLNFDYVLLLRKYKNILKSRNKLLKNCYDSKLISVYNQQLIHCGLLIQKYRTKLTKEFNDIITKLFFNISDLKGVLKIEYNSSWKSNSEEEIAKFMVNKIDYELKMKTTCYGPHRDNFRFIYDNQDFNNFASTGQLRLVSLILRAAQGIFYQQKTGEKPILLLDDVLLELDSEKRVKFMNSLPPYKQAFYTFLPDSSVLHNHNAKVFYIEKGNIKNEKSI